jgi:GTP-binding protein HflX
MRFHSKAVDEHAEVPLADDGRWEQLVNHWQGRATTHTTEAGNNRCYVLSVLRPDDGDVADAHLAEIMGLVDAQGDSVVGSESYVLHKPDPRTLIRKGVAERVAESARAVDATMLVVDAELSPSQTRNLEDAVGLPICDREAVILNVFERNAATRRARAQVEIAHLEYLRPRIRGIGLNMDQQMGGSNKARGPGETASELLARQLDGRLAELRRRLEHLKRSDASGRKHRAGTSRVVLVGYTNAGKTSLMNALTHAGLSAKDRPFETLDTTSRRLSSHGGDVLLSDSVGFIRRLPERLFASFESTLAELSEATLLLLVTDASDREAWEHLETTRQVLRRLGAGEIPRLVVFNKVDRLGAEPPQFAELADGDPHVAVSAHDNDAVERLREEILQRVRAQRSVRQLFVPYAHNNASRDIYSRCRVLETEATPEGMRLLVEGEPHVLDAIARSLVTP